MTQLASTSAWTGAITEVLAGWPAAVLVCWVTVTVLAGLFFYLHRYTRRRYFLLWGAAWLFYGVWLALKLEPDQPVTTGWTGLGERLCMAISAVLLCWGAVQFLGFAAPQRLMGMFLGFICVWSLSAPLVLENRFAVEATCFALLGLASAGAGWSVVARREHRRYVGARLLAAGLLLWGALLAWHPFSGFAHNRIDAGFLAAAAAQVFIAVSMIVLVLEETRNTGNDILRRIKSVYRERRRLERHMLESEERVRSLSADAGLARELSRAYESLRLAHRGIVEQERLSVLGQVASGMAHDINNALTPVIGFSEVLLSNQGHLPPRWEGPLRHILDSGRRIETIVARVRAFYRKRDAFAPCVRIDLGSFARDVTREFKTGLEQKTGQPVIHFEVDATLSPVPIHADPLELREMLVQILNNAVEAMPEGGIIRVACGPDSTPTPEAAGRLVLEISDTGMGMDEVARQRCTEPFFTTKHPRQSGLGLAVAYGTMRRHQGHLSVQSAPGRGTTIRLAFPAATSDRPQGQDSPGCGPVPPRRILCVDDEPVVLRLLSDVLTMNGHQVETRASGMEAIGAFHNALAARTPFDLVLTDLGMPDVDGRQVLRAVKHVSPDTPVIVLTGWADLIEPGDEVLDQVHTLLKKPLSLEQLQNALARLHENKPESTTEDTAGSGQSPPARNDPCTTPSGPCRT